MRVHLAAVVKFIRAHLGLFRWPHSCGWCIDIYANGSVTLSASTTNMWKLRGGVFLKYRWFYACNIALYSVITGASTVTSYQDHRPWLELAPGRLSRSFASDADITLNYSEAICRFLEFTSAVSLTATRNVVLPLAVCKWWFSTITSGSQSLQFIERLGPALLLVLAKGLSDGRWNQYCQVDR